MKIHSVFHTLQGEGQFAGTRALFVRMGFCNLSCSFCDTEFKSQFEIGEKALVAQALSERTRFAVITGGEPMMNKQTPLVIETLKKLGFYIATETNGNFPIFDGIDFVTCSPKRDANPPYFVHLLAEPKVNEYKYVVDENFDFTLLDRHDTSDGRRYSLSPEFSQLEDSVIKIVHYIEAFPEWKLSLQTHKWIGLP